MVYVHLAQERDQCEVHVNAIIVLWIPGRGVGGEELEARYFL